MPLVSVPGSTIDLAVDEGHSCHVYAIALSHLEIAMQAMKVAVVVLSAPL